MCSHTSPVVSPSASSAIGGSSARRSRPSEGRCNFPLLALLSRHYPTWSLLGSSLTLRLKGIAQIADRSPRQGDLILSNHTSYIDVLLLSALYNPTFLLPVFSALPAVPTTQPKYGRSTGTGSANISTAPLPQPPALGYVKVPFWEMMARTGSLPPTAAVLPVGAYKTLKEARRKEPRPVVLFAEGTTGNGRAILRFGEGVLEEGDVGGDQNGQVWVKYLKYVANEPPSNTSSGPI